MYGLWRTNCRHWWGQVENILIEFKLPELNGSCRAQTWMVCLTDGDGIPHAVSQTLKPSYNQFHWEQPYEKYYVKGVAENYPRSN